MQDADADAVSDWETTAFQTTITVRAWADDAFRRRLFNDPKTVIEAELGRKLPPTLLLSVHQEWPNHRHLVIPPPPADEDSR